VEDFIGASNQGVMLLGIFEEQDLVVPRFPAKNFFASSRERFRTTVLFYLIIFFKKVNKSKAKFK
jgi:hypothetical protein